MQALVILICLSLCYSYRHVPSKYQYRKKSALRLGDSPDRQLLEFVEPETNVKVVLVGSMHYNPWSIGLASRTIENLGKEQNLGSVIVESCPIRWNKTMQMQNDMDNRKTQLLRMALNNEMITASDVGKLYDAPIVLGDQLINITNNRMKDAMKRTVMEIASPFSGGWQNLYSDIAQAASLSLPSGDSYLGSKDFLDPKLLLNAPISLIRYPLAFILKAPKYGIPIISFLVYAGVYGGDVGGLEGVSILERIQDFLISFASFSFETALLSRVFLVTILTDRNIILADSIVAECKRIKQEGRKSEGNAVVAVLGMAHCNGVKKLILEGGGDDIREKLLLYEKEYLSTKEEAAIA